MTWRTMVCTFNINSHISSSTLVPVDQCSIILHLWICYVVKAHARFQQYSKLLLYLKNCRTLARETSKLEVYHLMWQVKWIHRYFLVFCLPDFILYGTIHRRIQNFLKGGVGHRKAKKKGQREYTMYDVCLVALCFHSFILASGTIFSLANGGSVRACVGWGGIIYV